MSGLRAKESYSNDVNTALEKLRQAIFWEHFDHLQSKKFESMNHLEMLRTTS